MKIETTAELRTRPFNVSDPANKREPKTDHFCCMCRKDLKEGQSHRWVHLIEGGAQALHPGSEGAYVADDGDVGAHPIGLDCAKKIGLEFTSV